MTIEQPSKKIFESEGAILERALTKCIRDRQAALSDLAEAARRVDKAAFGRQVDLIIVSFCCQNTANKRDRIFKHSERGPTRIEGRLQLVINANGKFAFRPEQIQLAHCRKGAVVNFPPLGFLRVPSVQLGGDPALACHR